MVSGCSSGAASSSRSRRALDPRVTQLVRRGLVRGEGDRGDLLTIRVDLDG
jgi:hypothetical protein